MPCAVYVKGSEVVPLIVPEQLSVVVGTVAVASHLPVTSAKIGVLGAILSSTVTIAVADDTFPSFSVTVKVTVFEPDPGVSELEEPYAFPEAI